MHNHNHRRLLAYAPSFTHFLPQAHHHELLSIPLGFHEDELAFAHTYAIQHFSSCILLSPLRVFTILIPDVRLGPIPTRYQCTGSLLSLADRLPSIFSTYSTSSEVLTSRVVYPCFSVSRLVRPPLTRKEVVHIVFLSNSSSSFVTTRHAHNFYLLSLLPRTPNSSMTIDFSARECSVLFRDFSCFSSYLLFPASMSRDHTYRCVFPHTRGRIG